MRRFSVLALFLAACNPSLETPPGVVITCDDGRCPSGFRCAASTQTCIQDRGGENSAPVITAFAVDDDPVSGVSVLRFTTQDAEADSVRIARLTLTSGGSTVEVPLATGVGSSFPSGAIDQLETSREGVDHSVTWDSRIAAPFSATDVVLTLVITDLYDAESEPRSSVTFAVLNQTTPRAEGLYVKADTGGIVPIVYRLLDEESDIADVRIEFSSNGFEWFPCTEYPSARSEGRYELDTAPGTAGGVLHTFMWNSTRDVYPYATVQLRLTASDGEIGAPSVLASSVIAGYAVPAAWQFATVTIGVSGTYAFTDVSGDGFPDAFVMGFSTNFALATLQQSAGMLSAITAGQNTSTSFGGWTLVDIDDDGDKDLVASQAAGGGTYVINVYSYASGFTSTPSQSRPSPSFGMLVHGDFDGDGAMTVVGETADGNVIADVLGGSPVAVAGLTGARQLRVVRLTADRDALVGIFADRVELYDGPASALALRATYRSAECAKLRVAIADIDGSGTPDLVCATTNGIVAWTSETPTVLVQGAYESVVPADLDGDGDIDLAALAGDRRSIVPLTNGGGKLVAGAPLVGGPFGADFFVGDVDGDARPDILADASGITAYWLSTAPRLPGEVFAPAAGLATMTGAPASAVMADIDRDGVDELLSVSVNVSTGTTGSIQTERLDVARLVTVNGIPTGTARVETLAEIGRAPTAAGVQRGTIAIADYDQDGLPDIAVASATLGKRAVMFGTPDGVSAPVFLDTAGERSPSIVACDYDGDGRPELVSVALNETETVFTLHAVDGARVVTPRNLGFITQSGGEVHCADLNADGRGDVVYSGFAYGAVVTMTADGAQATTTSFPGADRTHFGDWNFDGFVDIGGYRIVPMNKLLTRRLGSADGTFATEAPLFFGGGEVRALLPRDINDDGNEDIFLTETTGRTGLGNVDASFAPSTFTSTSPAPTREVAVGDTDGDGLANLVFLRDGDVSQQALLRRTTTSEATVMLDAALPAVSDRFGVPRTAEVAVRRYDAAVDGVLPARANPENRDFVNELRTNERLLPLTGAWRVMGAQNLVRVRDGGMQVRGRGVSGLRVTLPFIPGKTATAARVYFIADDWQRDTTGHLPRAADGRDRVVPQRTPVLVPASVGPSGVTVVLDTDGIVQAFSP